MTPDDVLPVATAVGLVAAAGVYALLAVTLATDRRLWPPGERRLAYYGHWALVGAFDLALLVVAVLDWNAWRLPRLPSLVAGFALAAGGLAVFAHAARTMAAAESMGLDGELYTDGPYAWSRNPQYVGMIVGLVGFALLANSARVAVLSAVHVGWVLLLPRAEERYLRERFGLVYERYRERVPRFVGWRTLRALAGQ